MAAKYRSAAPEVANLMAYGVMLNQAAKEYPTDRWQLYDHKFQELSGAQKTLKWNDMNVGLWNCCFTGLGKGGGLKSCSKCLAVGHSSWECLELAQRRNITGSAVANSSRKRPLLSPHQGDRHQLCFPFNNKGECDRGASCHFIHRCINCGEGHPQLACTAKRGP